MATHTKTGGNYGRRFIISRENGQADKNGRPYFFEWLMAIPDNQERRKFETRKGGDGQQRHYELFSALDGYLTGVDIEIKTFNGTQNAQQFLVLHMEDGGEEYHIEIGQIDGRYAMDMMKRLLDPALNPNEKLRIAPYAMEDNGKWNMGVSAISGVDTKLSAKKDDAHLAGIPQATSVEFKGKLQWDFTPISTWLYGEVKTKVVPRLHRDPLAPTPVRVPMPAPAPNFAQSVRVPVDDSNAQSTPANFDDLPF